MRAPAALCAALLLAAAVLADEPPPAGRGGEDLASVLGGDPAGFARALEPRPFVFPDDHAAHPDYRAEWWYFTGNLATAAGRPFGFQVTFFRFALASETPDGESAWSGRQVWMAHLALSDIEAERFHYEERLSREGPGLAGAATPFRVWLDDWSVASSGEADFPVRVRTAAADFGLDLLLEQGKPVVLQGERGLSRKSAEPGNASYYYSLTRMPARGEIRTPDGVFAVAGNAWLDREWSTSALADDQVGWDWFALQLADGRDLMVYRLRRRDGSTDPASAGVLVARDGETTPLDAGDYSMEPLGWWQAPDGGARYPAGFRLRLPGHGLDLEVRPRLADQELRLDFRYWEGAVAVDGRDGTRGTGYLEMTGYGRDGP